MKMKLRSVKVLLVLMSISFILGGCKGNNSRAVVTGQYYNPASNVDGTETAEEERLPEEAAQEQAVIGTDLFMIMNNDMQAECLVLEQIASGKQYIYYYTLSTRFLDKYGNRATVASFDPGKIIIIGPKDEKGRVKEVQVSDKVWEYQDVTRYSVDEEHGVFKIAGTKYSYDGNLYVNSDGQLVNLSDLTEMDAIRVIGINKKLLSVSVTTGHGELELLNTSLFEGSFIQIGNKIFAEITENMTLDIPEGSYTVTVANKGYGGSTEITIEKGNRYTLDLDTLKGEGPKYGNILFAIDVEGATLMIDGRNVDYSEAVELQYGIHTIAVNAEGYDEYSKKLFVNSSEATIVVSLTGEGIPNESSSEKTAGEEESLEKENTEEQLAGSLAGSLAGGLAGGETAASETGGGTASTENSTSGAGDTGTSASSTDTTTDYLSTLSELLSTLSDLEN